MISIAGSVSSSIAHEVGADEPATSRHQDSLDRNLSLHAHARPSLVLQMSSLSRQGANLIRAGPSIATKPCSLDCDEHLASRIGLAVRHPPRRCRRSSSVAIDVVAGLGLGHAVVDDVGPVRASREPSAGSPLPSGVGPDCPSASAASSSAPSPSSSSGSLARLLTVSPSSSLISRTPWVLRPIGAVSADPGADDHAAGWW